MIFYEKWLSLASVNLQRGSVKEINQIVASKKRTSKDIKKSWTNSRCKMKAWSLSISTSQTGCARLRLLQRHAQEQHSPSSTFPKCFKSLWCPKIWKSNLAAIKQPVSNIFSFLTNTHPPVGLGDTWQPEQVVKTDHYKMSSSKRTTFAWCSVLLGRALFWEL